MVRKSYPFANEDTTSSETSSDECGTLPDIDARVMGKEVLIEIHCEKENGVELKILDQLENLHLCVTGSSVLPFGNSALGITIIAQVYINILYASRNYAIIVSKFHLLISKAIWLHNCALLLLLLSLCI